MTPKLLSLSAVLLALATWASPPSGQFGALSQYCEYPKTVTVGSQSVSTPKVCVPLP
jgi:hypothetical protein